MSVLELTGMGSVLRGLGVLYWLVALACLFAAFKLPCTGVAKGAAAAIVIALFGYLPVTGYIESQKRQAYQREAWAYFRNKCATEAGEKIYKTFSGVKSVLVVKPLPAATPEDLHDQYWYGDPYSSSSYGDRAKYATSALAFYDSPASKGGREKGLNFIESSLQSAGTERKYVKHFYLDKSREMQSESIDVPTSRFGVSWNDTSTPHDRKYWVAGSRLKVIDLATQEVVAERQGFYIEAGFGSHGGARTPWLTSKGPNTTCPTHNDSYSDRWFVLRVLNPQKASEDDKQ